MPQLKAEFNNNIENRGHVNLLPSKNVDDSARKHTIKKQAFGELKNVIHNQCPKNVKTTPFIGKAISNFNKTKDKLRNEVCATPKKEEVAAPHQDNDIDLLNYFDFERKCCRKPYKSERQIWAEANVFDDAMLDNIIQGVFATNNDDDQKSFEDDRIELDKSDSEDILDVNNSKLFPSVFGSSLDDSSDDIHLPPVQMEKFDFF